MLKKLTPITNHICLPKKIPDHRAENHVISKDKKSQLEHLFLMDGITPLQASRIVNVTFRTAKRYFDEFAEELINEPEYESWEYRQKRVRARSLEGTTKKIIFVTDQRHTLEKIIKKFIYSDDNTIKNISSIPHDTVLSYTTKITNLTQQLMELQDNYDAVDSQPPAAIILRQEISELANEIKTSNRV